MSDLFGQDAPAGQVVGVVVNSNLWPSFDYLWPQELGEPQRGMRVRVPFGKGNRKTLAFVTATSLPKSSRELKVVAEVLDADPPLTEKLWELANWISRYYVTPLGMVLAAMIPSAVGRHAAPTQTFACLRKERHDWPKRLGLRQKKVLDSLLEARMQGLAQLPLEELLHHSGATRDTVSRLAAQDLLKLHSEARTLDDLSIDGLKDPFEINQDQVAALAAISRSLGSFKPLLLHGVTGSGKTEVYVRAIREVIAQGKQAILLVPEIALATQTLSRLAARLERVAVLHSGLSGAQRAFYYEQIRNGAASAVIGPRSAIFAPAHNLGLIIVDEEHESSYKQDNAPRYHARDVAIMRASMEGVPVVLGSATPSLESLLNVRKGRYELLAMPRRIRGLPMPQLQLVELRKEITPGKIELIGKTLENRLATVLDRREQAILLMNRRGYASYVFCPSCQWQLECEHCSRPLVWHQAIRLAMCHYCEFTADVPAQCPACKGKLVLFGLGIQRIENELARKFPKARVARMDSDTMTSPQQFQKVFDGFAAGEIDVLLGTQMVAKGLDFPQVTLVGIASADTALAMPDFRSSERTFQLIVQVAGRAGRSDKPGQVIVQTWHPHDVAIQMALQHDYQGFADQELPLRESAGVPPYVRLTRIVIRHANLTKARQGSDLLAAHLRKLFTPADAVRVIGPSPAGIFKIRNQFRFQVNCFCPHAGVVQNRLFSEIGQLSTQIGAELVIDPDPVNLG